MTTTYNAELKKIIGRENALIPPNVSQHEVMTAISALLYLICVLFRWSDFMPGWADYTKKDEPIIVGCQDASVAAAFVLALHIMPKGCGFLKIFSAKILLYEAFSFKEIINNKETTSEGLRGHNFQEKKNLPPCRPESGVLWFRYIDKNINYSDIFTLGGCYALLHAAKLTRLDHQMGLNSGTMITGQHWNVGILIVVVVASILSNLMTPMAACAMWLPYVLLISVDGASPWPGSVYLAALGAGIACNFGFCIPFQYTPTYYCHYTGKVPIIRLVKYSIPSVIMCTTILYLALIVYAPFLWDPKGEGFLPVLPNKSVKVDGAPPATLDPAAPAPPPPPPP